MLDAQWYVGSWFSVRVLNHGSSREVPFDTRSEGMEDFILDCQMGEMFRCSTGTQQGQLEFHSPGVGWGNSQRRIRGGGSLAKLDRILSRVGFLLILGEAHGSERLRDLRDIFSGPGVEAPSPVRVEMNSWPGSCESQAQRWTHSRTTLPGADDGVIGKRLRSGCSLGQERAVGQVFSTRFLLPC